MNKGIIAKLITALCACAIIGVLGACSPGTAASASKTAEQVNRAYMSQVNEAMVKLDENLDQFVDATSRGDVVAMRTQADNAYQTLDALAAIEAPEDMKDIRDQYLNGTGKLREALDSYIDLYAEAAAAGDSYDWSAQSNRIKQIQAKYDEGVKALKDADTTVAEAAAGSGSSASK